MVQISKNQNFDGISPKNLMDATYKAIENFQIRAFFEAKDEILKVGKFDESEFYDILDAMIDSETERRLVCERLKGEKPLFLEEIAKIIQDFPLKTVIRNIIYLKEQGYIEEIVENNPKNWFMNFYHFTLI